MKNRIIAVLTAFLLVFTSLPYMTADAATGDPITVEITTSGHGTVNPSGKINGKNGTPFQLAMYPDEGYMTESFTIYTDYVDANGKIQTTSKIYSEDTLGKPVATAYNITLYGDSRIYVNFVPTTAEMCEISINHMGSGFNQSGSEGYTAREGSHLRDIVCGYDNGFIPFAVFINNELVYSVLSPNNYKMLTWHEGTSTFSFNDGYNIISENMEIDVFYREVYDTQYVGSYLIEGNGTCELNGGYMLVSFADRDNCESMLFRESEGLTATIKADDGYVIESLTINDLDITSAVGREDFSYNVDNLTNDVNIRVSFVMENISITLSSSGNGRLSHDVGEHKVSKGEDFTVEFIPEDGYAIEKVIIDGKANDGARAAGFYTFEDVSESHRLSVVFSNEKVAQYTVAVSGGGNGTVLPYGKLSAMRGKYITFSITPDPGYMLGSIQINDSDVEAPYGNSFFLRSVSQDTKIYVEFKPVPTGNDKHTDTEPIVIQPSSNYGDVDSDKKVTMSDVVLLQKHIAKLIVLDDSALKSGDVDADENITMSDVVLVQKFIAKLIDKFPADDGSNGSTGDVIVSYDTSDDDAEDIVDLREMIKKILERIDYDWSDFYEDEEMYSEYSYAYFMSALSNARFSLKDNYAGLKQLEGVLSELDNALQALEYNADESTFDEAIMFLNVAFTNFGNATNDDNKYTMDSWARYHVALEEAKEVKEQPDAFTIQEIWDAQSALGSAYLTLRYEILNVDKDTAYELLGELLDDYSYLTNKIESNDSVTYRKFIKAYNDCKHAYENYSSYTLEQIDRVYDNLQELADRVVLFFRF